MLPLTVSGQPLEISLEQLGQPMSLYVPLSKGTQGPIMTTSKQDEIHIVCTVRAQPEHRDRVGELLLELVDPARGEAGCLYYDLYHERDLPDTFVLLDGWASEAALAAHAVHPNVTRVVEQLTPLLASPLEHLHSRRMTDPA